MNTLTNFRFSVKRTVAIIIKHIIDYPTPLTLSYLWGFGVLAGVCLGTQLMTGVLLAMHYVAHINFAFYSIEHIMRDVNNGWLLRYTHSNGASMFFIVLYLHIARGLLYSSYFQPRILLWYSGMLLFILIMATAFLGYVLPWGQMSYWGATVITNLFSVIPAIGANITYWIWGGYSVNQATLTRFFALHFLLPFVIVGLAFFHILLLHRNGSSNPTLFMEKELVRFYPYFYHKDLFGFLIFVCIFSVFIFFIPNFLGHPDNYIEANPMSTPAHIVPEWYFLPFYAILRSIPDKTGGVLAMALSLLIFFLIPFIFNNNFYMSKLINEPFFLWINIFFCSSLLLGFFGGNVVEEPYIFGGQLITTIYFFVWLVLIFNVHILNTRIGHISLNINK